MNRTICWTGSLFGKHLELPVGYYGSAKPKQKNAKGTVGPLQTEKIQRARNYWIVTVHRKIPEKFEKPGFKSERDPETGTLKCAGRVQGY